MGIPPDGFVQHFTTGRTSEIEALRAKLDHKGPDAVLLQANYGSGKSHLLRFIREAALQLGYAVSTVSLDAGAAVRFNRMDQILGAICRGICVPGKGDPGIRSFLDHVCHSLATDPQHEFWRDVTHDGKWDYSEALRSPAMFTALRAWEAGGDDIHDFVADWLSQPWQFRTQRKRLYTQLVYRLQASFTDPRSEKHFYKNEVFGFHQLDYRQTWDALADIHLLAVESGLKGLVVLFDEFEDVIVNLNNISFQEEAFFNLFRFCSGSVFPGLTAYAVTPEFASKCKTLLLAKGKWEFSYSRFEKIPTFRMSPLTTEDLLSLAPRVATTHGLAYGWKPELAADYRTLMKSEIVRVSSVPVQDRARQTIKAIVGTLDLLLEAGQ